MIFFKNFDIKTIRYAIELSRLKDSCLTIKHRNRFELKLIRRTDRSRKTKSETSI